MTKEGWDSLFLFLAGFITGVGITVFIYICVRLGF